MNKRRKFTAKFKTKVVLEALSERYTINEEAKVFSRGSIKKKDEGKE